MEGNNPEAPQPAQQAGTPEAGINENVVDKVIEQVTPEGVHTPEFKEMAKARLRERREHAEKVAESLGLPREAAPSVLAAMYATELAQKDAGERQNDPEPAEDK